ncbi:MAG: hypothetical protein U1F57_02335 [bacterium]
MAYYCYHCKRELQGCEHTGRGDICPFCNAELHCCLNCKFYDPNVYNECHETNADRVLEKDRANFCDYFTFLEGPRAQVEDKKKATLSKLDELFKKK